MPSSIVSEILRGGAEKVAEAGGVIAGGHTIDDEEPKYGLAVLGFVHPARVATKAGARPGDKLVLNKPLGVGIITTAAKGDAAESEHLQAAVESMVRLNRRAARLMQVAGFHAATDITGLALTDRVLIVQEGTPGALYRRPTSDFVARFLRLSQSEQSSRVRPVGRWPGR